MARSKADAWLAMKKKSKSGKPRANTLAKGRPPTAKPQAVLSKKATNSIIRSHHQLNKQIATAKAQRDEKTVDALEKRISENGGLSAYQAASIQGQSAERGGDSSIVLVKWLDDIKTDLTETNPKIRMLEVGALSAKNACSKSKLFSIECIDLNAQEKGITQQDFMQRPLPHFGSEQFDIISLSLVLNYVAEPAERGEMLKRTCQFLDQRAPRGMLEALQGTFPALFLVLPAACIYNSRWMNEERLTLIMASLGYVLLKYKQTAKLVYQLWQLRDPPTQEHFAKREVNPGGRRNNFSIVLPP